MALVQDVTGKGKDSEKGPAVGKKTGTSLGRTAERRKPRFGADGMKETFPGGQTRLRTCSPGSH